MYLHIRPLGNSGNIVLFGYGSHGNFQSRKSHGNKWNIEYSNYPVCTYIYCVYFQGACIV